MTRYDLWNEKSRISAHILSIVYHVWCAVVWCFFLLSQNDTEFDTFIYSFLQLSIIDCADDKENE